MAATTDPKPNRELVALAEAARLLTISPRTLRGLIARGQIPVVHVTDRRLAIHPDDLDRYIASRRR